MNNIPPKVRRSLAENPYYRCCARRAALRDHECRANPLNGQLIEWEHALIHAGKQVQEEWAIVPICWWAHSGPGLEKEKNVWIALNRATDEQLLRMSKAVNYIAMRERLNFKYGEYSPAAPMQMKINYA